MHEKQTTQWQDKKNREREVKFWIGKKTTQNEKQITQKQDKTGNQKLSFGLGRKHFRMRNKLEQKVQNEKQFNQKQDKTLNEKQK